MTDWQQNQLALQRHLKEEKLENLLRWSTVEKTMFVGDVGFVHQEYDILAEAWSYNKLVELLKEPKIGNPKMLYGWTSGNLIHQLYHLKQWLDRTKQDIREMDRIVEFGAGYGAMALICRRLGFEGDYHIIDLPELTKIQGYYLHNTAGLKGVLWTLPESCDLFIGCHSLSEVDVETRERYLSQMAIKEYLFASSYEFEGVDNQRWFHQLGGSTVGVDWLFYAHPYQENAFYQVGIRI